MKKWLVPVTVLVLLSLLKVGVYADKPPIGERGLKGQAGNSNVAFVELWEKDPATWYLVEDGAWGKLKYNPEGRALDYLFNAHRLVPDQTYTLTYYPEPQDTWPWLVVETDAGTANEEGDIHLQGSYDFGEDLSDAKIWLVLAEDIVDGQLSGYNPTEYLYEYDVISYQYVCD
jgi:hypothetical protein